MNVPGGIQTYFSPSFGLTFTVPAGGAPGERRFAGVIAGGGQASVVASWDASVLGGVNARSSSAKNWLHELYRTAGFFAIARASTASTARGSPAFFWLAGSGSACRISQHHWPAASASKIRWPVNRRYATTASEY